MTLTHHYLTINRQKIHVVDCAIAVASPAKPTLIFLHCLTQDWRVWHYQLTDERLADYRRIAIDLPGHGESEWASDPTHGYAIPQLSAVLEAVISALAVETYLLIGVSLGANVALQAQSLLAGCQGVIAMVYPLTKPLPVEALFRSPNFMVEKVYQESMDAATKAEFLRRLLNDQQPGTLRLLEAAFDQSDPRFRPAILAGAAQGQYDDEVAIIEKSPVPVGIVLGMDDQLYNMSFVSQLAIQGLWRGTTQLVPNAGHLPMWDNPREFNHLLIAFESEL